MSRTHNCHYIPAGTGSTAEFRLAGSMSWPEEASFVCVSPADEFTAGDHHRTIKVDPLVFDGGVLGSKAAGSGLSICAVNFSLNQ